MWKAASRALFHKKLTELRNARVLRLVCLTALSAVVLIILVAYFPSPCRYRGHIKAPTPAIPYRSSSSAYREMAAYVTTLPTSNVNVEADREVKDALASPSPQRPPRGVQTRARRQEALEAEIEKLLSAHGIHRERHIRVRFLIVSNRVDWELCTTIGAAAVGGYSIPVVGFDSPYYSIERFTKYVEFVEREGLDDDDIIVKLDSDVFWSGADFVPFPSKFARFSPETEADLDVAAVRAWEDYGEKKAPLFMKELQAQADGTGDGAHAKRPAMQMAPVITNGEEDCAWGQHSKGYVPCGVAFTAMDHLIEVARNHVSSYNMSEKSIHVSETGDELRKEMARMFPGATRWMMDDMLRQPNASSLYTTKAPRDRSDPLFYRPTVIDRANPTTLVNTGMQVSRVWALKRLVRMMTIFGALEKPVGEQGWHGTVDWKCDQGTVGELYTRSRLFEVEHNLLSGPPLSTRTPPVQYDPRFGPPGLIGVDRRTEMVVLGGTVKFQPKAFHHSVYLNRFFPASGESGANFTEVHLGSSDPREGRLGDLQVSRGGVLVTPPLLWRSATEEDQTRGYEAANEADPDVVRPPFIHYAGGYKHRLYNPQRHLYSWLVAARHDRQARQSFHKVLREELVELWYKRERVYVNYSGICKDITEVPVS